jgi:hypothetical protein
MNSAGDDESGPIDFNLRRILSARAREYTMVREMA